jgi:hypothetical protein
MRNEKEIIITLIQYNLGNALARKQVEEANGGWRCGDDQ